MRSQIHKALEPSFDLVLWLLLGSLLIQCDCRKQGTYKEINQITASHSQADEPTPPPSGDLPINPLPDDLPPQDEENSSTTQKTSHETLESALKKFIGKIIRCTGKEEITKEINEPIKGISGNNLNFLQAAVVMGHKEYVQQLLQAGADVNVQDNHGHTVFHMAAERGDLEVIKVLLDSSKNLKLDLPNDLKKTALHIAAEKRHVAIVKALLDKKAPKDLEDKAGKKPIDLAKEKQKELTIDSKAYQDYQAIISELSTLFDKLKEGLQNMSPKFKQWSPKLKSRVSKGLKKPEKLELE